MFAFDSVTYPSNFVCFLKYTIAVTIDAVYLALKGIVEQQSTLVVSAETSTLAAYMTLIIRS